MDIGIDLGTTFSVIAVNGRVELVKDYPPGTYLEECDVTIIPTPYGEATFPSVMLQNPDNPDEKRISQALIHELDEIEDLIKSSDVDWIIVSNEVGMGLVPPYPLGRLYRDSLGWANQRLVSLADEVYLMIAGKAVPLHAIALDM